MEASAWRSYIDRYRAGEWRDRIFRDMIVGDIARLGPAPVVLDIGCGKGFDGDIPLQRSIGEVAGSFIGIEPDPQVAVGDYFTTVYSCSFEEAPLESGSITVAYSIMVLEHLREPARFWQKLYSLLAPNGVFWGMTVDARHWVCRGSRWLERLALKDIYLDMLHGARGVDRYENYPAHYRANSPAQILPHVRAFRESEFVNFCREDQCSGYFPPVLRSVPRLLGRRAVRLEKLGTLLAVRLMK
jgi:SAM-dependent methyltransferase